MDLLILGLGFFVILCWFIQVILGACRCRYRRLILIISFLQGAAAVAVALIWAAHT